MKICRKTIVNFSEKQCASSWGWLEDGAITANVLACTWCSNNLPTPGLEKGLQIK
jgi:hypothetical protein